MADRDRNSPGSDLFRTSAFLLREHMAHNSMRGSGDGGIKPDKIIYVYDSDVIITRCAPWITGPAESVDPAGNGYGQIFAPTTAADGESVEDAKARARSSESIALILARYALSLQSEKRVLPILQMPSHFHETNNIYRGVRRKVEAIEKVDRRRSRLRRDFELARLLAFVKNRLSTGNKLSSLNQSVGNIADLLAYRFENQNDRARTLREWDTYFELEVEYGGIYSAASAGIFYDDPGIREAFEVFDEQRRSDDEQNLYRRLRRYWRETLRKPGWSIDADADALALLFLINLRLKPYQMQVAFVTGDKRLVECTYCKLPIERMLGGCIDLEFRGKAELLARDFSLLHVRHLWAFVSDALIEQSKTSEFIDLFSKVLNQDMFSGLLARWSDKLKVRVPELEALALGDGRLIDLAPHQVNEVLRRWSDLTNKAIQRFELSSQDREVRDAIVDRLSGRWVGTSWIDLIGILEEDVARVRDRAVLALAALGVRQVIQAQLIGTRNPPEIFFDSLVCTNNLVQRFTRAGPPIAIEEFRRDFAAISEDCHDSSQDGDDRQESYLKFVVLGAAFASAERWLIANSYAHKAIAIIRRSSLIGSSMQTRRLNNAYRPRTNMSGREAFFLGAVSQRILARDSADIDKAEKFLKEAEQALEVDHAKQTAKNVTAIRFKNERVALSLSQYYLARSRDENFYFNEIVLNLYIAVQYVLSEFESKFRQDQFTSLERVTVVGAATNVIQCYVIGAFRRFKAVPGLDFCPVRKHDVALALNVLRKQTTYGNSPIAEADRITATPLMRSYACAAEILVESNTPISSIIAGMEKLQANPSIFVTHYDRWRYSALLSFIKQFADRHAVEAAR